MTVFMTVCSIITTTFLHQCLYFPSSKKVTDRQTDMVNPKDAIASN